MAGAPNPTQMAARTESRVSLAAVEIDQVTINSMTLSPMATSQVLVGTSGGPRAGPTTIGQRQGLQIQDRWLLDLDLEYLWLLYIWIE
jgi:hypothetical protein